MASRFQLVRPTTVADASAELDRLGDRARVYAGGAELLLLMRERVIEPDFLVDIKRIADLDLLAWDGHLLQIGATVTHQRLERDQSLRTHVPTLALAEAHIGNIRVRNQGTLGGNLAFADPHSDPGTPLLLHEATVAISGPGGLRSVPLSDFIISTYETALAPNEILVRVSVPALPRGWRSTFRRIERYSRPTVNVAAAVLMNGRTIGGLRLVVGCVGPRPIRLCELEGELRGSTPAEADARLGAVREDLTDLLEPIDDLLGSAEYKLHLASVLLRRALAEVVAETVAGVKA